MFHNETCHMYTHIKHHLKLKVPLFSISPTTTPHRKIIMLRLQLHGRTFLSSGAGDFSDHQTFLFTNHRSVSYSTTTTKLNPHFYCHRRSKNITTTCNYASGGRSNNYGYGFNDDSDDDYLEAIVLMTETLLHYQMRIQGYQEAIKWQPTGNLHPLFGRGKGHRTNMQTIGPEFLSQFRSPTIFLKIPCNCDEDYLLPIIVAESAVEKLITSSLEDQGSPNQFQLVRNIVGKLGYEVKLIQITERMDNIYVANICFHKPGTEDIRVDARPSDAINVATRCRAPIYVSKQIVLTDAIKIVYEKSKLRNKKPVYDVFLDSAIDGPDELAEELDLVAKMNLAAKEERYSDAAMWKDKLLKLRSLRKEA